MCILHIKHVINTLQDHTLTFEELTTFDNGVIIARNEDVNCHLIVNVSPQRPQGMDYIHNTIGKIDKK